MFSKCYWFNLHISICTLSTKIHLSRYHQHIQNIQYHKKKGRNDSPLQPQLIPHNRRQFEIGRGTFTSEAIFSAFLLIVLFLVGFVLGYNFSQSSLLYNSEVISYPTGTVSNSDVKTITTYSNSSVTNTNNDKDTITNTVSSG